MAVLGRGDVRTHVVARGHGQRPGDPHCNGSNQQAESQRGLAQRGHLGKTQRDAGLERVGGAEGCADNRGADAHGQGRDRAEAQPSTENQHYWDQRDDLLVHVLERAQGGKREADERDDHAGTAGASHE